MHDQYDLVLYCKSYRQDFLRLQRLSHSVTQFNAQAIPFYVSTPQADYPELLTIFGGTLPFMWLADETILEANLRLDRARFQTYPGGLQQQLVKAEFWRLGIAKTYVCLDSDCVFLRQFAPSHFMNAQGEPYTVIYDLSELFGVAQRLGYSKVEANLRAESERVMKIFGRTGSQYACPCPPFIWSSTVWQSLDEKFLQPQHWSIDQLITRDHPESLCYLEALLRFQAIAWIPIGPLFRVYFYDWFYLYLQKQGETQATLTNSFIGVIYQSNWDKSLDYGASPKSPLSKLVRAIKARWRALKVRILT